MGRGQSLVPPHRRAPHAAIYVHQDEGRGSAWSRTRRARRLCYRGSQLRGKPASPRSGRRPGTALLARRAGSASSPAPPPRREPDKLPRAAADQAPQNKPWLPSRTRRRTWQKSAVRCGRPARICDGTVMRCVAAFPAHPSDAAAPSGRPAGRSRRDAGGGSGRSPDRSGPCPQTGERLPRRGNRRKSP